MCIDVNFIIDCLMFVMYFECLEIGEYYEVDIVYGLFCVGKFLFV